MAVQSCTFKKTSYADGDGEGQATYGALEDYTAKAACHSVVVGPRKKVSSAFAAVGDTVIWGGHEAYPGRVKLPWVVLGIMRTSIQRVPPSPPSEAEATVEVTIGVWDRTDDTRETEVVLDEKTSGQSEKKVNVDSRRDGRTDQFTVTYVPGHKYTAYIRLEVRTEANVPIEAAPLSADGIADFFGDRFGAQLRFVEWEFDMPDGVTLLCNLTEA